jgi:CheY-like chemotaxis protein
MSRDKERIRDKESIGAKERILVVDDSADAREVLRRNLTSEGYDVVSAPGVAEAVEILDATRIDLVITDLKMPKVGGLDLIKHVRARFRHRSRRR